MTEYPRKVFRVGLDTIVACFGLDSDAYTIVNSIRQQLMHHTDEDVSPEIIARGKFIHSFILPLFLFLSSSFLSFLIII